MLLMYPDILERKNKKKKKTLNNNPYNNIGFFLLFFYFPHNVYIILFYSPAIRPADTNNNATNPFIIIVVSGNCRELLPSGCSTSTTGSWASYTAKEKKLHKIVSRGSLRLHCQTANGPGNDIIPSDSSQYFAPTVLSIISSLIMYRQFWSSIRNGIRLSTGRNDWEMTRIEWSTVIARGCFRCPPW